MKPFAIAGIQMHLGHGSNIEAMRQRIDLTMHLFPWVQMVMFSELACYGPLLQHAQPLPGAAEDAFRDMARHHRIWIVNGSMYERRDGGIFNTTSVVNPEGDVVGRYRKMFPFLPLEQGVQARLVERGLGLRDHLDLAPVGVDADHLVALLAQAGPGHEADIPCADDRDPHQAASVRVGVVETHGSGTASWLPWYQSRVRSRPSGKATLGS